jgi:hypothetical protein
MKAAVRWGAVVAVAFSPLVLSAGGAWAQGAVASGSLRPACPGETLAGMAADDAAYCAEMGPVELVLRSFEPPLYPIWRLNLTINQASEIHAEHEIRTSTIVLKRLNLGPSAFRALSDAYGAENVDPALNDPAASDEITITVREVLPSAGAAIERSIEIGPIESRNFSDAEAAEAECFIAYFGLTSCLTFEDAEIVGWEPVEETEPLRWDAAPWDTAADFPHAADLARLASYSVGWRSLQQVGDIYVGPGESEGEAEALGNGVFLRRSLEGQITIDSQTGNGGGMSALALQPQYDDSVRATVAFVTHSGQPMDESIGLAIGGLCGRGEVAGSVLALCP